ncbi:MAG: hypothetical protein OXD48_03260 [Litoreibacter sp.]|nr:hypothetical protein [Litoreibacter sp.]
MRIVIEDRTAGRLFGHSQVSVRAETLIGYRGIARAQVANKLAHVTLSFDAPQIVTAQGGLQFDIADGAQVHSVMPLSDRQARQLIREMMSGRRVRRATASRGLAWI